MLTFRNLTFMESIYLNILFFSVVVCFSQDYIGHISRGFPFSSLHYFQNLLTYSDFVVVFCCKVESFGLESKLKAGFPPSS